MPLDLFHARELGVGLSHGRGHGRLHSLVPGQRGR